MVPPMSRSERRRTWTYHDGWFPEGYRNHWEPVLEAFVQRAPVVYALGRREA
jgi:hypothetical protein